MKIILTRQLSSSVIGNDDTEQYIRTAMAHVTHLIWIKNIDVSISSGSQETVIIECEPQGSTLENKELADIAADALKMRGDLRLESISITPTIQVEGIKKINNNLYAVQPWFAEFLSRKDNYRAGIQNQNVIKVTMECRQAGPNSYTPTGKIGTQTQGTVTSFNPSNPYNCFATAVSEDSKLKEKLLQADLEDVRFSITDDGKIKVNVIEASSYTVNLPQQVARLNANATPSVSGNVASLFARVGISSAASEQPVRDNVVASSARLGGK